MSAIPGNLGIVLIPQPWREVDGRAMGAVAIDDNSYEVGLTG